MHLMTSGMSQADAITRVQRDGDGTKARLVRARQRLAWGSVLHPRLGASTPPLGPSPGALAAAACARRVGIFIGSELAYYRVPHSSSGWGVRIADSGTVSYTALGTPADEAGLRVGDTIVQIGAEGTEIEVSSSEEVVGAIRALTAASVGAADDGTPGPKSFSVGVIRAVAPTAADVSTNLMMIKAEQQAGERFSQEQAAKWRPPLPGTLRTGPSGVVRLSSAEVEDRSRWAETARDFSRLCKQAGSVMLLQPAGSAGAERLVPLDAAIRAAVAEAAAVPTDDDAGPPPRSIDDSEACFAAMQTVLAEWLQQYHQEGEPPPPQEEELTRLARLVVYQLTVKPAMEVCLACKIYPPAMYQPRFLLAFCPGPPPAATAAGGGGAVTGTDAEASLRVLTIGFVGSPVIGDRPDTKATPYLMRLCSSNLLVEQPAATAAASDAAMAVAGREEPEPEPELEPESVSAPSPSSSSAAAALSPYLVHYNCQVTAAKRSSTAITTDVYTWLPAALQANSNNSNRDSVGSWAWPLAEIPYLANDSSGSNGGGTVAQPSSSPSAAAGMTQPQIAAPQLHPAAIPAGSTEPRRQQIATPMRLAAVQDDADGGEIQSTTEAAGAVAAAASPTPPPPIARPGSAARTVSSSGRSTAAASAAAAPRLESAEAAVELELRRQPGQGYGMEISTTAQVTAFRRSAAAGTAGGSTAAEQAGVVLGSYITHVDGQPVASDREIVAILRRMDAARPGCVFTFVPPRVEPRE